MKRKGQALVEFVMILPLIIYLLLGIIDFAIIISNKQQLENKIEDIIYLYKDNASSEKIKSFLDKEIKDVNFDVKKDEEFTKITLKKKMQIITPGLELILGSPYYVEVERVVLSE